MSPNNALLTAVVTFHAFCVAVATLCTAVLAATAAVLAAVATFCLMVDAALNACCICLALRINILSLFNTFANC